MAAEQRGLGDLMGTYFDRVAPEARAAYEEWSELPDETTLRSERENVETVVQLPGPDRLMPWATAMGVR
jgi:hypothetical protein